MFDSVRARLTLWYTGVLALVLIVFASTFYLFLSHKLTQLTDQGLADMGRAFAEMTYEEEQEILNEDKEEISTSEPDKVHDDSDYPTTTSDDDAVIEAAREYKLKDYQFHVYDGARQVIATSPGFAVGRHESKAPVWVLAPASSRLTKLL